MPYFVGQSVETEATMLCYVHVGIKTEPLDSSPGSPFASTSTGSDTLDQFSGTSANNNANCSVAVASTSGRSPSCLLYVVF